MTAVFSLLTHWRYLSIALNHPYQIAEFMGTTWSPPGSCRPQVGPMLTPWTLLSGYCCYKIVTCIIQSMHMPVLFQLVLWFHFLAAMLISSAHRIINNWLNDFKEGDLHLNECNLLTSCFVSHKQRRILLIMSRLPCDCFSACNLFSRVQYI